MTNNQYLFLYLLVSNKKKRKAVFQEIEKWINAELKDIKPPVIAVGTGGNINKLYKLSNQQHGLSISFTELNALRAYVSKFDNEQRKTLLKMNPDRADVILPASEIYIEVMKIIGADRILVPGVGLKDGLLYTLYENSNVENIKDIQFLEIY